jgi:putative nucleotidyltransferase with HDIG domain
MLPSRAAAFALVQEYTTIPGLIKHMRSVEIAMRAYAAKLGEDVEQWGLVGLLHDFDYERWPNPPDHPLQGSKILRERGYPEDIIRAILSHADYLTDYPRLRPIEKGLYACDELSGFICACAKVQPAGINELSANSVRRKMKKKDFAAKVNRDDIVRGAAEFGVDLEEHIQFLIEALRPYGQELGIEAPT